MLIKVWPNKYLNYATRDDWLAHRYRIKPNRLRPPVGWVKFSHTETPRCEDPYSCGKMVRTIQETFLDNGFWDIPYNYLIGGDKVVYEGRATHFTPDLPKHLAHLEDDCIDIAYIGNFSVEDPPWEMMETALTFVAYGVIRTRQILPTFRVVPYREKVVC
ncbi:peptidoglycan-recognition protein SB2-like [Macrosteles quadrilineatus]|uniref:peptidoglycan-recognition protein SB2-like n=1 Tax=Macrosteles quadrilineatus TaxID=74068 RepID=UPI0023E220CB|nr:peptidoglycan-recognition protein SB2-like [Macrosteles quadrilineatus]